MKKLAGIFPPYYHCQKVEEVAFVRDSNRGSGATNLKIVEKALQEFRAAVGQVDSEVYEGLGDDYECIEYAIARLEKLFQMKELDDESRIEACIFSHFLCDRYRALERLAHELDERCQE